MTMKIVVRASLPASFGGKMPPLPSIFKGVTMFYEHHKR